MRRKLAGILALLVILLMSGIYTYNSHREAGTVEEAVKQSGRQVDSVIYQGRVKNGAIVFFTSDVGNNEYALNAGFVKKNIYGWKWVWGGGFSGENEQYFPQVKGTPFPLLFGRITDKAVNCVEVSDKAHNYSESALIEGSGSNRIWFVLPDEDIGPNFSIVWQSDKGEALNSENENVLETSCYATESDNYN